MREFRRLAMRPEIERLQPFLDRARDFSGWSFDDLDVRNLGPPLPWNYDALVREHAFGARAALDMGTGGGERLARLRDALPSRVVATEEWRVNAPLARERLRPLGVGVVRCASLRLPFANEAFDLVLNRHEELDPAEVARVLCPGGRVLTQQVGRSNWCEVGEHIPRMVDFGDLFGAYTRGFADAGLDVRAARQHEYSVAFGSLGDVVFMLGVTPWLVPDLDLERDGDALLALEAACTTPDGLVLTESRFVIVAEQPR